MVSHAYHASLIWTLGRHVAILLTMWALHWIKVWEKGGLDFRVLLGYVARRARTVSVELSRTSLVIHFLGSSTLGRVICDARSFLGGGGILRPDPGLDLRVRESG